MKHFPEKVTMAAIILSCGFFAQSGPSEGSRKPYRPVAENLPKRSAASPAVTAVAPSGKPAKALQARAVLP